MPYVRRSRIGAACPGNAYARNDSRFTGTSLGMSEVTILEGRKTFLILLSLSAVFAFEFFFLAQNATGDLFEWKYGIFGDDSPGSQLNRIVWRRTLALRAATNCPLSNRWPAMDRWLRH